MKNQIHNYSVNQAYKVNNKQFTIKAKYNIYHKRHIGERLHRNIYKAKEQIPTCIEVEYNGYTFLFCELSKTIYKHCIDTYYHPINQYKTIIDFINNLKDYEFDLLGKPICE